MRTLPKTWKTLIAICTLALVSTTFTSFAIAQQGWPQTTYKSPVGALEIGAKALSRPSDDLGLPLATDSVTNQVLFNSDQATELTSDFGGEIRYISQSPRWGNEWEFRSFLVGMDKFREIDQDNIEAVLFPELEPDEINYLYESDLASFEFNFRRALRPGVTMIAGPRLVYLRETATSGFEQLFTDGGIFNAVGSQEVDARNTMYGGQLGFEFNMPIAQSVYIQSYGKFGGFANPTKVKTTSRLNTGTADTVTQSSKSTGTFLAEVGGKVFVELIPGSLFSYVGYEAMWMDGVALAPAQFLTVDRGGSVETANTPFWHSINFGLRFEY